MLRRLPILLFLFIGLEIIVLAKIFYILKDESGPGRVLLFYFFSFLSSAVIGIRVVKNQGIKLLLQVQESLRLGSLPREELLGKLVTILAGLALILPGFVSDVVGFLLFLPFIRPFIVKILQNILSQIMARGSYSAYHTYTRRSSSPESVHSKVLDRGEVIDIEAVDDKSPS